MVLQVLDLLGFKRLKLIYLYEILKIRVMPIGSRICLESVTEIDNRL